MFDPSLIWPAFAAAGMLVEVTPASGSAFTAGFRRPDTMVLDGLAQSADYSLEYQTADATLRRDDMLTIGGTTYKVKRPPMASPDGHFSTVYLTKQ